MAFTVKISRSCPMRLQCLIGFSLSPGGLLLPYHLGVMDGLKERGIFTDQSPIAGSSAGAICAASVACGLDTRQILDATIDISDTTQRLGGARGRLLPLLKAKLLEFIDEDRFQAARDRDGSLVVAYRELFPLNIAVHQKEFESREDLLTAVCHSSTFPFFATNWPAAICTRRSVPRVVVDGFFAVPRTRFGCPDFGLAGVDVDHTVCVSVFPKETVGMDVDSTHSIICPEFLGTDQTQKLFKLATQSSSAKELLELYENGSRDVERWHNDNYQTIVAIHSPPNDV